MDVHDTFPKYKVSPHLLEYSGLTWHTASYTGCGSSGAALLHAGIQGGSYQELHIFVNKQLKDFHFSYILFSPIR